MYWCKISGKRTSFGSQSQEGSIFVGRILTVVSSLRSQNRNVLEFIIETVKPNREERKTPSLIRLSQTQPNCNSLQKLKLLDATPLILN